MTANGAVSWIEYVASLTALYACPTAIAVPTMTAWKTDRTDSQSPQPTAATRSAVGSVRRTAASTSMPSGS